MYTDVHLISQLVLQNVTGKVTRLHHLINVQHNYRPSTGDAHIISTTDRSCHLRSHEEDDNESPTGYVSALHGIIQNANEINNDVSKRAGVIRATL